MAGQNIGGLAANVSADVSPFTEALARASRSAQNFGGRLNTTGLQLDDFARNAASAAAAYLSVSELISRSDEWTVFSNKIRMATETFGTYQETQRAVYNLAQSMAAPVDDVGSSYLRLQNSVKSLGVSQADTLKVTEGLLKSFISFGQSGAEAASTVQQLGQALGAGKLNGDELKSVMENSLPVAEAIAKQFGVTTGELKKLGEEGKLTSKEVFQGLLNGSDGFIKSFENLTPTFSDGFTVLSNSATRAVGEFANMTGASESFGSAMYGLASRIDNFADTIESGKFGQLAKIFERQWQEVFGDRIPDIIGGMYEKLEEYGDKYISYQASQLTNLLPNLNAALKQVGNGLSLVSPFSGDYYGNAGLVKERAAQIELERQASVNLTALEIANAEKAHAEWKAMMEEKLALMNGLTQEQILAAENTSKLEAARKATENDGGNFSFSVASTAKPRSASQAESQAAKAAREAQRNSSLIDSLSAETQSMVRELDLRQQISDTYRAADLGANATYHDQQLADIRAAEQVKTMEAEARYAEDMARLQERRAQDLSRVGADAAAVAAVKAQYDEQEILAEEAKQQSITDAQRGGQDARKRLRDLERQEAIDTALGLGSQLMQVTQGHSKRAFEFSKKMSIASAAIAGYESATDAWQKGMKIGGPWLAAAFSASSLLKTGSLIQSIRGTNFSGGGGGASAGGGGVPSVAASAPSGGGAAPGPSAGQTQMVSFVGDFFNGSAVEKIAKGLVQFQKDGGTVVWSQ